MLKKNIQSQTIYDCYKSYKVSRKQLFNIQYMYYNFRLITLIDCIQYCQRFCLFFLPKVTSKPQTTQTVQRILLPAAPNQQVAIRVSTPNISTGSSVAQIRPANSNVANIAGLPPGTTLLSGGSGLQGFALVPASYVTQVEKYF